MTRILCLALVFVALLAAPVSAQVTILDASANSGGVTVFGGNAQTFASATSAGSDRIKVCAVNWQNTVIATAISSITYGTVSIVANTTTLFHNGGIGVKVFWATEANLSSASNSDLVVTWNDTPDRALISCITLANAATVTGENGVSGNGAGPAVVTPTGADANSMALGFIVHAADITLGAGPTQDYNVTSAQRFGGGHLAGATTTHSWTVSGSDSYGAVGVTVTAAGGAPAPTPKLLLLGVGGW